MIHPTAIIEPGARLGDGVEVGPWTLIGADVEIGEGTRIGSHVVIKGPTRIGARNQIFQFCSLGDAPQDKKYGGEASTLEIGDDNVIREYCTFNRGTEAGGGVTRVGSGNWIMAYVHIAHDCIVGDQVTMANAAALAGHVELGSHAILGGYTMVHQFCRLGERCFSAMGSVVLKDVLPFVTVSGNPAAPHGLNAEGLRRHGYSAEAIAAMRRAYKAILREGRTTAAALERLEELREAAPEAAAEIGMLHEFLAGSGRGIAR